MPQNIPQTKIPQSLNKIPENIKKMQQTHTTIPKYNSNQHKKTNKTNNTTNDHK